MSKRIPKLCRHKATGQAVVRRSGRDFYLGVDGTPEAKQRYDQLIAEWLSGHRCKPAKPTGGEYLAIHEASKRWTMPIKGWKAALNHFAIGFENRLPSSGKAA